LNDRDEPRNGAGDSASHPSPATEEWEQRELVRRISDTPAFRNAPRIRDFLIFVADRALSGRIDEITEQQIGHQVFHRGDDYDTANDNSVRVSARQLRSKLRDYFDAEGHDEAWRVEIPKGAYVPVFSLRTDEPGAPSAGLPPPSTLDQRWRSAAIAFGISTLVLAAAAFFLWRASQPRNAAKSDPQTIVDLVLRPSQRTLVVLADSSMVFLQRFTGKALTVEEYANRDYLRNPDVKNPEVQSMLQALVAAQLTSVADMGLAARVIRFRGDITAGIEVVHARSITARNLKEDNLLLLGGPRSNPWVSLFEDRLNFRFSFPDPEGPATILNTQSRAGEALSYLTGALSNAARKSYARVALVPNLSGSRNVLLVSGTTIEATEAAAEFVLSPRSPELIVTALGIRALSPASSFEILLETSAVGGTAKNAHVVACRLYHN
jgi:hypothetical protein